MRDTRHGFKSILLNVTSGLCIKESWIYSLTDSKLMFIILTASFLRKREPSFAQCVKSPFDTCTSHDTVFYEGFVTLINLLYVQDLIAGRPGPNCLCLCESLSYAAPFLHASRPSSLLFSHRTESLASNYSLLA